MRQYFKAGANLIKTGLQNVPSMFKKGKDFLGTAGSNYVKTTKGKIAATQAAPFIRQAEKSLPFAMLKAGAKFGRGAGKLTAAGAGLVKDVGKSALYSTQITPRGVQMTPRISTRLMAVPVNVARNPLSILTVGAAGMLSVNVMKGMQNQSQEIVYERYLQDARYSRGMLHNSRVGLASQTRRMLKQDGTQGLSNALSATRHGR